MAKQHIESSNLNSPDGDHAAIEKQWIEQSRQGDMGAFRKLVEKHESQIYSTVLGMLAHEEDARDVTQQTFIRFFKSLANFRGDAQLSTYLTRIAINLALNELKRRSRKGSWMRLIRKDDPIEQIQDHSQDPERFETQALVQQAIQMLSPEFRSVVVLRMIEGYSTQETADILELPMGTIGSRLNRAQKQLKTILSTWLGKT